jgi:hypothetical protein
MPLTCGNVGQGHFLVYEATTESATTWLHVACVGYLLTKL